MIILPSMTLMTLMTRPFELSAMPGDELLKHGSETPQRHFSRRQREN
jgi:hypothetical protein